jgi:diguanylate cyclase (GGDEF)-like protein
VEEARGPTIESVGRVRRGLEQAPRSLVVVVVSAVALVLLVAFARMILDSERAGRASLEERAVQRTIIAEHFIEASNADLQEGIESHAEIALNGPDPSADQFRLVSEMMRFRAAVLLDSAGHALQTYPSDPALVGADLSERYDHLHRAVSGERAISGVVTSAVTREPIVAFAVPYDGPNGRRVFSAGYRVEDTPLGAYLRNSTVLRGEATYLVDEAGTIIASSGDDVAPTLDEQDHELAAVAAAGERGTYQSGGTDHFFSAQPIDGAPWRLVRTLPSEAMYAPTEEGRWIPWLLFAGFLVVGLASVTMLSSIIGQRDREHRRARRDPLTGVANRRSLDATLRELVGGDRPWSVLMIDVDHFKAVNDSHGHHAGDEVLAGVAATIRDAVRSADVVGRWGGEEFMVLVPDADLLTAADLAERVRASVADRPGTRVPVTVSIGYASSQVAAPDGLVDLADASLYRAKETGRNRSVCLTPDAAFPAMRTEEPST